MAIALRPATPADAERLARTVIEGAGQAHARRFYEREGWLPAGDEFHAPAADPVLIEYRYAL